MTAAGLSVERLPGLGWVSPPLLVGLAALCVGSGLVVSRAPALMVGAVFGLAFVFLLLSDLLVGVLAFVVLQFFAAVPGLEGVGGSMVKVAGAVLVIGWLAALTASSQRERIRGFTRSHPWTAIALAAFVLWNLASVIWARDSGPVYDDLQRYILNFVLLAIVFTAIRTERQFAMVAGTLALGGAASTVVALLLFGGAGRLSSTFGDSNEFAAALVPTAILAVALSWTASTQGRRVLFGVAAALCVAGIVLSLSRGALLALPIAFVVWAIYGGRWRTRILGMLAIAGAFAAAVFLLAAPPEERDRVFETEGGGTGRSDLWNIAVRIWQDEPVFGVGLGNFNQLAIERLQDAGRIDRSDLIVDEGVHAHSMYLGILAETGAVGMALFLTTLVAALAATVGATMIFARKGNVRGEALSRAMLAALVGIFVASQFLYLQFQKPLWVLLGMAFALYAVARAGSSDDDPLRRSLKALRRTGARSRGA